MALTDEISLFHMWVTFAFLGLTIFLFVYEKVAIELTATLILCALITVFHIFPLYDGNGLNQLNAHSLLKGFANPALITVISLIIVGNALTATGALSAIAPLFSRLSKNAPKLGFAAMLIGVCIVAAFMNNTPVVVIFIPILLSIAAQSKVSAGQMMMPLSYVSILGGMTTLIGSSTNLMVSRSLTELGLEPLYFFEFTFFGVILASTGLIYTVFILPNIIRSDSLQKDATASNGRGRQFIAHLKIQDQSTLIGKAPIYGFLSERPDISVLAIWRGKAAIYPPFTDTLIEANDTLVIAVPRDVLTDSSMQKYSLLPETIKGYISENTGNFPEFETDATPSPDEKLLMEAMVSPNSRLINNTLRQSFFSSRFGCFAVAIQRRAQMSRSRIVDIKLKAGDVLLLYGNAQKLNQLRGHNDLALLQYSEEEAPRSKSALPSLLIFLGFVFLAITELVPIVVAALFCASLMILTKAISPRSAIQSIDFKLICIVAVSLGLGTALELTGGATYLAESILIHHLSDYGIPIILSAYFLIVAIFTNLISNNACAVLFTPIGVHVALAIGVDPHIFAIATLFAANCSFCTPVGYQTNLLVMGPGGYKFKDFLILGTPLAMLIWIVFSIAAPLIYDL